MLKKILLFFLILLCFIFFTNCTAHINKAMNSWLDHHKSELIASWGPPNQISSDGKDGEILIYYYNRNLGQTPGLITNNPYGSGIQYTAPQQNTYTASRMFYVNSEGKIYYWRWQGF